MKSIHAAVEDFVDAVREGRPYLVAPEDAAYAVRIVEKAYESAAGDGRRVEV
jgi:predicted dehydrogenase